MENEDDDFIPHIEEPDEMDDDNRNGLVCFLNDQRICRPDCMAFTTEGSESPYLNDQQKHCMLIVSVERLARYSGGLLSLAKNKKADDDRKTQADPPGPQGA